MRKNLYKIVYAIRLLLSDYSSYSSVIWLFSVFFLYKIFVKATTVHPANLGSAPAGTRMSHQWRQEGHLANIA